MLAGLCMALTAPVSVAAQTDVTAKSLRLSVSTFGGYDTDVTGHAGNAETAPNAPHGGAMAGLAYEIKSDKTAFSARGAADSRYYFTDDPFPATSYFGNAVFASQVTSRLNVSASVNSGYSPQLVFSPLPRPGDVQTDFAPPTLDYGVTPLRMFSYAAGGNASLRVSRRSSLTVALSDNSQRLLDDDYKTRSLMYGGGYSYSVSKYATLRLGYYQQDTDYGYASMPKRRYAQRTYDIGVNYSKPLSISRRTTLSFNTGSSAFDDGQKTYYNVTGSAGLTHQIGRTWEANLVYARGLGVIAGFVEPGIADSVNANLRGNLSSRFTTITSAGFSNGNVGLAAAASDYLSYQASTRLEWIVERERTGIYASYYYYAYQYDAGTPTVVPIANDFDRQGVQVGLIFRVPLIRERGPRVTR
jgi:hypothetical protein